MNIPQNLKYTREHEWILVEGNHATVGITDFAQSELGDIVFIEIETAGESLNQGDVFGTIEAVKTVSDLFMPVAGTVNEINPDLESQPDVVNKDPYGKGWLIKISVADVSELNQLLSADEYAKHIGA
jgi:glycine cleavage system H protein